MTNNKSPKISSESKKHLSWTFIAILVIIVIASIWQMWGKPDETIPDKTDKLKEIQQVPLAPSSGELEGAGIREHVIYYLENGGHFQPGIAIYQVGEERILSDDFNFHLYTYYPETYKSPSLLSQSLLDEVFQDLVKRSVYLQSQSEVEEGLDQYFLLDNIRTVDIVMMRNSTISRIIELYEDEHTPQISGEKVSIWFRNVYVPKMGLEEAKEITNSKITALYKEVSKGNMSMEEAGDAIRADEELKEIDIAYVSNAYGAYELGEAYGFFFDKDLNDKVYKLEAGELSEVMTGKDSQNGEEAFYTFVRINEKVGDGKTIEDLYNENKSNYSITIL